MPYRRDGDWAQQVPPPRQQGPYRDYGWELGESVLPEFRKPDIHEMPYDTEQNPALPGWQGPQPGPHRGKGPRGYQRSDERIMDEVCGLLTQHGYIDARDIEVSVQQGEVTLKGTVDSRMTKRMAEDVADSVYGVTDVHNELHIRSLMQEKETNSHQELPEQAKSSRKG